MNRSTRDNILFLLLLLNSAYGQTFSDFIDKVNATAVEQRDAVVDSFIAAQESFPLIETDSLVYFIYQGGGSKITIPCDANLWSPNDYPMTRLSTTDLWYLGKKFEPDARLEYCFSVDEIAWILDDLNANISQYGYEERSVLEMPKYVPPQEILYDETIPHGNLIDDEISSSILGNTRPICIYTPPGYEASGEKYPLIMFNDGGAYLYSACANNILDYLIARKQIRPVIALFVPAIKRTAEYAGGLKDEFALFIVNELLPYIDHQFRTYTNAGNRAVMGASDGGIISLFIGLTHPQAFANVGIQSSLVDGYQLADFPDYRSKEMKIYLDVGTYDRDIYVAAARDLVSLLAQKEYAYEYHEYHEGHTFGNWRAHLDDALKFFFPYLPDDDENPSEKDKTPVVIENFPNPFHMTTVIRFCLPQPAYGRVTIFDSKGREVSDLVNDHLGSGVLYYHFDGSGLASGIYICNLNMEGYKGHHRMVLIK